MVETQINYVIHHSYILYKFICASTILKTFVSGQFKLTVARELISNVIKTYGSIDAPVNLITLM